MFFKINRATSIQSDSSLLTNYKEKGELRELQNLFKKYIHLVYGVALFHLERRDRAQDAVMEIFEEATVRLKIEEVDGFKNWLYLFSHNYCVKKAFKFSNKSKKEKENTVIHNLNDKDLECQYYDFVSLFKKNPSLLEDALPKLDSLEKDCLMLFYKNGKNCQEIAFALSIDKVKVKHYLNSGRRHLTNLLDGENVFSNVKKTGRLVLSWEAYQDYFLGNFTKNEQYDFELEVSYSHFAEAALVGLERYAGASVRGDINELNEKLQRRNMLYGISEKKEVVDKNYIYLSAGVILIILLMVFWGLRNGRNAKPEVTTSRAKELIKSEVAPKQLENDTSIIKKDTIPTMFSTVVVTATEKQTKQNAETKKEVVSNQKPIPVEENKVVEEVSQVIEVGLQSESLDEKPVEAVIPTTTVKPKEVGLDETTQPKIEVKKKNIPQKQFYMALEPELGVKIFTKQLKKHLKQNNLTSNGVIIFELSVDSTGVAKHVNVKHASNNQQMKGVKDFILSEGSKWKVLQTQSAGDSLATHSIEL